MSLLDISTVRCRAEIGRCRGGKVVVKQSDQRKWATTESKCPALWVRFPNSALVREISLFLSLVFGDPCHLISCVNDVESLWSRHPSKREG
jgi:hypothetical protein